MPKVLTPVIVDDRQKTPPSDVRSEELRAYHVPSFVDRIEPGDYQWFSDHVQYIVEEKLVQDLLASAGDGRIGSFLESPVTDDVVKALLVVGAYEYGVDTYKRHWNPSAIDAILVSVQTQGVVILRATTPHQAAERIADFWRWTGKDETSSLLRTRRPDVASYYIDPRRREAVRVLMTLAHGIGEKTAKKIIEEHHSLEAAIACIMSSDKCPAQGVGPKLQNDMRKLLQTEFA